MNINFFRTEEQARAIADKFCEEHLQSKNNTCVQQLIYPFNSAGSPLYVYSLAPIGFVIVSGDTRAYTILGYSFNNNLDIQKQNVRDMIEDYKKEIRLLD